MTENLPVKPTNEFLEDLHIIIPDPIVTTHDAGLDETRKADIETFNMNLRIIYAMWAEVRTFNQALALVDKSMDLIRDRRNILGHPYGAPSNTAPKISTFEPLP